MKKIPANYTDEELQATLLQMSAEVHPSAELLRSTLEKLPEQKRSLAPGDFVRSPLSGMFFSTRSFWAIGAPVLVGGLLVIVGGSMFISSTNHPAPVAVNLGASTFSAPSSSMPASQTNTTNPQILSMSNADNDSDDSLAQDTAAIDAQLSGLDSDVAASNQSPSGS